MTSYAAAAAGIARDLFNPHDIPRACSVCVCVYVRTPKYTLTTLRRVPRVFLTPRAATVRTTTGVRVTTARRWPSFYSTARGERRGGEISKTTVLHNARVRIDRPNATTVATATTYVRVEKLFG